MCVCLYYLTQIRKQAIKDLPALLKDAVELLPRVADVLTQLLQTEDSNELSLVHMSLLTLMRINTKGVCVCVCVCTPQ